MIHLESVWENTNGGILFNMLRVFWPDLIKLMVKMFFFLLPTDEHGLKIHCRMAWKYVKKSLLCVN